LPFAICHLSSAAHLKRHAASRSPFFPCRPDVDIHLKSASPAHSPPTTQTSRSDPPRGKAADSQPSTLNSQLSTLNFPPPLRARPAPTPRPQPTRRRSLRR
jgi:hypothetical protein